MSSVVIAGDTSGSITLEAPAVAGTTTLTLPATSGTVLTTASPQIASPAFSAYQSSGQTLSSNTETKIKFQTKEYDTANAFDATTNYRFQPLVAGYYSVIGCFNAAASYTTGRATIYKNGASYKVGMTTGGVSGTTGTFTVACQVYLNGSTDYIECYGTFTNGQGTGAGSAITYFQAAMVRGA